MKTIQFLKMVATGNDFIMIDHRNPFFPTQDSKLIQGLCDRRKGIGADGLLLIENSATCDFKMRIINPDGSEVGMCGNGARCAVFFARTLGIDKSEYIFETLSGKIKACWENDMIRLNMGIPKDFREKKTLKLSENHFEIHFVNTGVEHAVIFVPEVSQVDVKNLGRLVRFHRSFKPKGTNCNFVEITGKNSIKVRTYERGVEDETFSCGTGTCACAIISVLEKNLNWPITSVTPKGETLKVYSEISLGNREQEFFLIGSVSVCFKGEIEIPTLNG